MRVILKETVDLNRDVCGWLTSGKEYVVLELQRTEGEVEYRIESDMGGTPPLFESSLFDVVDPSVPATWVTKGSSSRFKQAPAPWLEPGFWERMSDDEPEAVRIYRQERDKLIA